MPKSIRWRLPLSYAGIALLATLTLGAVLLLTLRQYYNRLELDYLKGNAQAVIEATRPLIEADLPANALETQLKTLSFLSQTRVRLFDETGQIMADSGSPTEQRESLALGLESAPPPPEIQAIAPDSNGQIEKKVEVEVNLENGSVITTEQTIYRTFLIFEDVEETKQVTKTTHLKVDNKDFVITESRNVGNWASNANSKLTMPIPIINTVYGFGLNVERSVEDPPSAHVINLAFVDNAGNPIGTVELSEGPAYGRQILQSVAAGWMIASAIAVLLAGAVGWLISRRLSQPLLNLTEVTAQMAHGNFSARATINRADEIGLLAQSFNDMAGQVEGTVITLRRFIADAAHELNTPLTALNTNLELAASEADSTPRQNYLAQAQAQALRLERLSNSLLDLSRLENESHQSEYKSLSANNLLQSVGEIYASQAEQAEIDFSLNLPTAEALVWGKQSQLQTVLGNLLDNALKFTPAGGKVTAGLLITADKVNFVIEDSGIGIPAEDIPQLFNRFHRGKNTAAYPGSGLGLAICQAIVENHNGKIAVTALDPGTRFTVILPCKT